MAGSTVEAAGDVIGPPARFLGAALATPVAAGLHFGLGTDVPVQFSPTSDVEQFRTPQGQELLRKVSGPLPRQLSPEAASFLTSIPAARGLNLVGRAALMPAARAALEPVRGLPLIKQGLEFAKTGASLPAKYRTDVQNILRTAEGQADLSAYLREKLVSPVLKLPEDAQASLRRAIELRDLSQLPPEQQRLAQSLLREYESQVTERLSVGLRPYERRPGVAYAGGRVATREAQAEMFRDYPRRRFSTEPRGLSTGKMGQIAEENLPLTTEEVAAKVQAAVPRIAGKPVFEPLGRATLLSGQKHDTRLIHARIINDLVKKYRIPTANPKESIAGLHEGLKTGFSPAMRTVLETNKLPPQINELVGNLNKRMQPEEFGRISRAMQWVNTGFKKWALFSPGYTSRNLQNNVFQIAVMEDLGPRELALLKRTIRPDQRLTEEAIRMGVIGRGQTAQEIARSKGVTNLPLTGARAINTTLEDKSRLWLYLIRKSKGDAPLKAASRVDDVLFNYSQRLSSRARREVGRKYIPFVNWSTFIPGLTARAALERPGSVALFANMRERQNERLGYTEERLSREFGPWNLPQGVVATKEGRGLVPQFAGQYSVNDWVPTSIQQAGDKLLSRLYPTIGVPGGLITGREPFSGRPFKYGEKTERFSAAPSVLRTIFLLPGGKEFAAAHGISIDPATKKVMAPARLSFVLGSFPQARIANLVADYAAGVKGKEEKAASFLTGIREVPRYEGPQR